MHFNDEAKQQVTRSRKILLADDGIVTGQTTLGFKQEIYSIRQSAGLEVDLECFAMLVRPNDPEAHSLIRAPFYAKDGNHLHYGALAYLPSEMADCPWCRERQLLETLRPKLTEDSQKFVSARIRALEKELEVPFLVRSAPRFAHQPLTLGSFFGTLAEKSAFAATSSVAHQLGFQVEEETKQHHVKFIPIPFVLSAFFDAVILAGFFRTLSKRYWYFAGFQRSVVSRLANYPARLACPGNIAELLWAAANGILPTSVVLELVDRNGVEDVGLRALKEIAIALAPPSRKVGA